LKVSLPPAIVRLGGRSYVAAGCLIPCADELTREEAEKLYIVERIDPDRYNKLPTDDLRVEVKSSKGDKVYNVTRFGGQYSCECTGYGYRRRCRHIEQVKRDNQ
jgi:hypothetical protein